MLEPSTSSDQEELVCIDRLTVTYGPVGADRALSNVNLRLRRGEIVGVLGESGSGKSTLALTLLGLLPPQAEVSGSIAYGEQDLLRLQNSEWQTVRGARIAMIFQEPGLALSPVMRVGSQIAEVLSAHKKMRRRDLKGCVNKLLKDVGLSDAERIFNAYPHQLSGGQLHRVAVAQALACEPELLIADEPTRSLDVTRQQEILNLFRHVNQRIGCTIVFITHDPALLAGFADRVMVLYAGHVVEDGPASEVLRDPLHPYSKGLLELMPGALHAAMPRVRRLPTIAVSPFDLKAMRPGCIFASRCSAKMPACDSQQPLTVAVQQDHNVNCFIYGN